MLWVTINHEYNAILSIIKCRRRDDKNKCGFDGKYFEQDVNVEYKILLHTFVKNLPLNLCFFVLFINVYITILMNKK
jgi:hypothetical protein